MKKSKIGFVLSALYLLVTIIIVIYAKTCSGMFCGMVMVLPTMPWVLILEGLIEDSIFVFFILVILNSGILYGLGYLLSSILKKTKFFHSS
jgi:hypothetical protein